MVCVDERAKRTGGYIELLGTYNPLTEPKEIKLTQDRIDHWIKQGAQMSTGFLRIIGKAPQRPPRKPKKEKVPKVEEIKTSVGTKVSEEKKVEQSSVVSDQPSDKTEQTPPPVIPSASEESSASNEQIATEPSAPRNDEGVVESETKDERPT